MKKFLKTQHAYMFKMITNVFQVIFSDKSQVIFFTPKAKLFYLSKGGVSTMYDLKEALETKIPELSKRIRYAKDIMQQAVKKKSD